MVSQCLLVAKSSFITIFQVLFRSRLFNDVMCSLVFWKMVLWFVLFFYRYLRNENWFVPVNIHYNSDRGPKRMPCGTPLSHRFFLRLTLLFSLIQWTKRVRENETVSVLLRITRWSEMENYFAPSRGRLHDTASSS